jgi:hypothetical protein
LEEAVDLSCDRLLMMMISALFTDHHVTFLGTSTKISKAAISFVISVHPFVRLSTWKNSAPTGRILIKLDI